MMTDTTPLHPVADATDPVSDAAPEAASDTAQTSDRAKRPDLLDAIVARGDMKRSDVKLVMDLLLDELGKLLDTHEEVAVPPIGKFMVKKRLTKPGGDMLTLKLKRSGANATGGKADPDDGEGPATGAVDD